MQEVIEKIHLGEWKSLKIALFVLTFFVSSNPMIAQNNFQQYAEQYAQFDFWVGEWDVYKFGTDTIVGKSRIEHIINKRAIQEHYESTTSPYKGTSLNKYDPKKDKWEQFWVDNGGLSLHIIGTYADEKMTLISAPDSNGTINKIYWSRWKKTMVRQIWEQSNDGGATWTRVFDGLYKTRKNTEMD